MEINGDKKKKNLIHEQFFSFNHVFLSKDEEK